MYIYEKKGWPNFIWKNEEVYPLLIQIRHLQGLLIGGMESLGFQLREESILQNLTQDVVKSSEIEGEILNVSHVRSSIAQHLGLEDAAVDIHDRNIDGVVEMVLDATQNYNLPLTKERLWGWHAALFPTGWSGLRRIRVGAWRKGTVRIVSGRLDKDEVVHYEAPPAENVDHEMKLFLDWSEQENEIDLVLKAAIAHFWFEAIHPFDDGNGRVGRAIADHILARSENTSHRFYSLSAQIQIERKQYYSILEQTSKGGLDITPWIKWFLGCLERAIQHAIEKRDAILSKAKFWEEHAKIHLNERQKKMINLLLDGFEGKLTSSKWAKITKCSQDTAHRDILELIELGLLSKNPGGGRNTSYSLQHNKQD